MNSRVTELIWRGDSRSAVKAISTIAKQSDQTKRALKGDSDEEALSMDKVRESSSRLRDAFGGLLGMVGIGGVAFGFKDLIEGGMSLQSQQSQLQAALNATGQAAAGTAGRLRDYAESMSTRGGFATTQNLQAMTGFVRETHSASEAQKLLALSTNIARGRGIDLASAQQAVARAYTGSVRGLQLLIGPMVAAREAQVGLTVAHQKQIATIQQEAAFMRGPYKTEFVSQQMIADHLTAQQVALAQLTDKHTTAQQALTLATREFAGATSTYSHTTQGQMSNLRNSLSNLTESLGQALLPALNMLVHVGERVASWMSKHRTIVLALAAAVSVLAGAFGALKIIRAIRDLTSEASIAMKAGSGNAVKLARALRLIGPAGEEAAAGEEATGAAGASAGVEAAAGANLAAAAWKTFIASTIIGLVLVGLLELVEHWKLVEKVAVEVWHGIETVAKVVWQWIKGNWPLLAGILLAPFTGGLSLIAALIYRFRGQIEGVIHSIASFFHGLLDDITWPFRTAIHWIEQHAQLLNPLHWISAGAGAVGHFFGSLLNQGGAVKHLATGGGVGTDTVPALLTPGEGVISRQGMAALGGQDPLSALNAGMRGAGSGGSDIRIMPAPVTMRVDSRVLAEAVVRFALDRAARGPSSLVGGALVTGAPGLPL